MSQVFTCLHCGVRATYQPHAIQEEGAIRYMIVFCTNCRGAAYGTAPVGTSEPFTQLHPVGAPGPSADVPEEVRSCMEEARDALQVNVLRGSALMSRAAVQAIVRSLGAEEGSLWSEIESLNSKGLIPKSLTDWSHEIRRGGNPAAHPKEGETVEPEDAEELYRLVDAIAYYLFVVPAEVERRKARRSGTP